MCFNAVQNNTSLKLFGSLNVSNTCFNAVQNNTSLKRVHQQIYKEEKF